MKIAGVYGINFVLLKHKELIMKLGLITLNICGGRAILPVLNHFKKVYRN
jgi:hypothetical protein